MSGPEDAEGFEWDDDREEEGNVAHLARHGITPQEAEEVWYNGAKPRPNRRDRPGRWLLVGRTNAGRLLTLVFVYLARRRLIRFITGWDSTDAERSRYL